MRSISAIHASARTAMPEEGRAGRPTMIARSVGSGHRLMGRVGSNDQAPHLDRSTGGLLMGALRRLFAIGTQTDS